jgi:hypothetical protein
MASAQVPSLINYQGRLTDSNGSPITGTKNFSLQIFDAETGGNLLYTETIGEIALGANGVYSFQFGSAGTSNTQVSETVATTNGTSTTFQKILDNSPVVAGSVGVTDGTYTWSQSGGSSSDDDFGVAYSTSLRRVTVNYYDGAPAAGRTILATYRYGTSGITGALSSGAEHWMSVSVDGTTQGTRQRILAVPFASMARAALRSDTAMLALSAPKAEEFAQQSQETAELALFTAQRALIGIPSPNTNNSVSEFFTIFGGYYNQVIVNGLYYENKKPYVNRVHVHDIPIGSSSLESITSNSSLRFIRLVTTSQVGFNASANVTISGEIKYLNGSSQPYSLTHSYGASSAGQAKTDYIKPTFPGLEVQSVSIQGTRTTSISLEASVWLNEPRTVEINLPAGFISNGEEYKVLLSYTSKPQNSQTHSFIVGNGGSSHPLEPSQWQIYTSDDSTSHRLRLVYTPDQTDSHQNQMIPEGVIILKK